MSQDSSPTGPRVPTQQAIDILNQNASSASKRSRYATLVQVNNQANRDSLRRDFAPRTPTDPQIDLPGTQAVPADQTPPRTPLPTQPVRDLLSQFQGSGSAGGGGGGFAGGGGGSGSGAGQPFGSGGPSTGGGNSGVQTFTNPEGHTPRPQAVIRFERTNQMRGGEPVYRAIMGPASDPNAPFNWFVGAVVNPRLPVPNVSRANFDIIRGP